MNRNSLRAFTLLELMLAMLLFATVVVFMATIWAQHAHIIGKSRNRMVSSFVAEQKTEEWIGKGWANAFSSSKVAAENQGAINVTTVMRGQEITIPYKFRIACFDHPDPGLAPMVGILQVTVSFPDEQKDATFKEIQYETYLAKPTK